MATIQELQNLSNGSNFAAPSNQGTQIITVQNTGQNQNGSCLPCDDGTICEVGQTQGARLDLGQFSSRNKVIRFNVSTVPNPDVEQNIVFMPDFSIGDSINFPGLAPFILPVFGETSTGFTSRTIAVVGAPATATITSAALFLPSDVGTPLPAAMYGAGAVIASFTNSSSVQASAVGNGAAGPFSLTIFTPFSASLNGNLINSVDGAPLMAQFNNALGGGYLINAITLQYNSTTSAGVSGVTIETLSIPIDPRNAVCSNDQYSPLCDFCSSNSNGDFTTHKYIFNGPANWNRLVVVSIPASEEGLVFTMDVCIGAVGIRNTDMDTYEHQASSDCN